MIEFMLYISSDGELTNEKVVSRNFSSLTPGRWLVTIKKSNKRTLAQNNWLHAILPDIVRGLQDVGYREIKTTDQAKEVLKQLFFKKTITNGSDEIQVIEPTSETSKEIFIERAEEIIIWAKSYLGIDVAPPGKVVEMFH